MHGSTKVRRKVEIYRVFYSYKTQRKNVRESSCDFMVLEGTGGKNEARRLFYKAFLDYNFKEKHKKMFNGKILNVELIEEKEIEI
ncbi:hypothetical protein [Peptacetobacter sp. AB845]|uniref:hypothetical protein n=1 Tax=Peptacetobacter sp. AB845 TaxID=3388429 RepID=UPI0039C9CA81